MSEHGHRSRLATAAALAAAVGLLVPLACHGRTTPLAAMFVSPEAVAEAVLERLAGRDLDGLRGLAVSEGEFRGSVWPQLPASRPERNLTADYVWTDLSQKSDRHLRQVLARHGGERWRLSAVRFEGETTDYGTVRVHRKTALEIEDQRGERESVRLFGSMVEQGGRFKIFSYVID